MIWWLLLLIPMSLPFLWWGFSIYLWHHPWGWPWDAWAWIGKHIFRMDCYEQGPLLIYWPSTSRRFVGYEDWWYNGPHHVFGLWFFVIAWE